MNGQRDKKERKLTKSEGRSSVDANVLVMPGQGSLRTTVAVGPLSVCNWRLWRAPRQGAYFAP